MMYSMHFSLKRGHKDPWADLLNCPVPPHLYLPGDLGGRQYRSSQLLSGKMVTGRPEAHRIPRSQNLHPENGPSRNKANIHLRPPVDLPIPFGIV